MLTSLGFSVFLTMGVMTFSLVLYAERVYPHPGDAHTGLADGVAQLLEYSSLLMATPVFLLLGWPILTSALKQASSGAVAMDALIVLGVAGAFFHSYVATLLNRGDVYFETACVILVLVTLGRYLESQGKLRAAAALRDLEALLPDVVRIRRNTVDMNVAPYEVRVGDVVIVPAGTRIPVDGRIVRGNAHVDEQVVSGESAPVARRTGDAVRAGSLNLDGLLDVSAEAVAEQSTLSRLTALLDEARRSRSRFERLAERVSRVFVPLTICLAVIAGILGWRRDGATEALMSALAMLLISCPCALGIATPLAVWAGLGRAAREGLLFKTGDALEALAGVRAIAFDKTGTLTRGIPRVDAATLRDDATPEQRDHWLGLARSLATATTHPMSLAIADYAAARGAAKVDVNGSRSVPGLGVVGEGRDGTLRLGSVAMMREAGVRFVEPLHHAIEKAASEGLAIVCLGVDERVEAVFALDESVREESADVFATLRCRGLSIIVLTGDQRVRAKKLGQSLRVETRGELRPEDKLREIHELRARSGAVAMVGDGLNDGPALAAADVGVAMGCGADLTRDAAQVCLLGDDLRAIPAALDIARKTVRTIRRNLFWAFAYNAAGMGLALWGMLNPIVAAGAMVASSLFVVTNSMKLGWERNSAGT